MSRPATGLRPAAARSRAVAAPPIEVPRAVLVGADERSGIFLGLDLGLAGGAPFLLGLPRDLLGPVGDRTGERRAGQFGLRRFGEAAALQRLGGVEEFGQRAAPLPLAERLRIRRNGALLIQGFGHVRKYGPRRAEWKGWKSIGPPPTGGC